MTTFEKIAALIFRLVGFFLILYSVLAAASAFLMMPGLSGAVIWALLPYLVAGFILFRLAIPLARVITHGFD